MYEFQKAVEFLK